MKIELNQDYFYKPGHPVCCPHAGGKKFIISTKVKKQWQLWFQFRWILVRNLALSWDKWRTKWATFYVGRRDEMTPNMEKNLAARSPDVNVNTVAEHAKQHFQDFYKTSEYKSIQNSQKILHSLLKVRQLLEDQNYTNITLFKKT